MLRRHMVCLVLPAMAALAGCKSNAPRTLPTVTIDGRTWRVDLAMADQERYLGLSGRKSLPDDMGMLFIYPSPQVLEFCMRNCYIPLDIAFIGPDLRVKATYTMQAEPDLAGRFTYSSREPAQYALEVSAGALERAGVKVGSPVRFSSDMPAAAKAAPGP